MSKKPHYIFNHYIPKFILNRFANESYSGDEKIRRVWVYDVNNNSFDYPETKRALGKNKLYWDDAEKDKLKLERDLNTKLEQIACDLFTKRVYAAEKIIELSRDELGEIKRYMLAQMVRTPADNYYELFHGGEHGKFVLARFSKMLELQGRKKAIKDYSHLSNKEAMNNCCVCKIALSKDEVGLSKKLLGRNIEKYHCIKCFAEYLDVTPEDLQEKIKEFKAQGCALFK